MNKNKKVSKKAKRPAPKKKVVAKKGSALQVVKQSAISKPMKEGGKYMIPKSWIGEKQVLAMLRRTPAQFVYTRPAKGGGTWDYVPVSYVEKILNWVFGWNWDFEVVSHEAIGVKDGNGIIICHGKLTVKGPKGESITKSQFGRKEVAYLKNSKNVPLDLGNDYKAAASDALKKCASLLGIAADIYSKREFRDIGVVVSDDRAPEAVTPASVKAAAQGWECFECGTPISNAVATFSKQTFGRPLCSDCQKAVKASK